MLLTIIFPGKLLAQAPAIASFTPATGPVGTLVTISGTNLNAPTALNISGQNAIVVSNTSNVLVAMVMPGAATGAVSITTAGGTASGTGNFTVTATKYPSVQQGAKLAGTGNTGTAVQGVSVAVSADGNTAILGGSNDNSRVGAAWVFVRNGSAWTQQGSKLVGTGAIGAASQGSSVALSADGNTAIIGGAGDNNSTGAAWVFTRSGSTWTQQGSKLVGTGAVGAAGQGNSVSISADGNTGMVGGTGDNSGMGASWVFTRSGSTWTQQGSKLAGTGFADVEQGGYSVALSADGNTAIVGGNESNFTNGAAWVYARSGGAWTQQGAMVAGKQSAFGSSVSLSADGNTAVIGAPGQGGQDPNPGGLWVYVRSGSTWTQQGSKITETGSVGRSPQLGYTVSLSADGNTVISGGYSDNAHNGAAWVFTRTGGAWAQQGPKLVGTGNTDAAFQGRSVAISADGGTALSGGPDDNSNLGAAWVFTTSSNALLSVIKLIPASILNNTGTTGSKTTYTTTASNGTASVTVTPTTQDPTATIKVNGVTVLSGTASGSITLGAEGTATTINTIVTAQDGVTTHTYSITVNRAPSSDALLSILALTPASTLNNTGTAGGITTYTTSVGNSTASVTVTPTAQDADATIMVNGKLVSSGTASGSIALPVGQTTITTVVTAQGGTATHTYSITVTRAPSGNARLSIIKLTPAAALTNTGTAGTATTYTTTVGNATASVTVTPTAQDNTATITVNGTAVTSATASGSIALAVGHNIITTVVTAQNGTTTRAYSITVTRLSNNALLSTIKLTPASALTNTGTVGSTTTYTTSVSNAITSVTVTATTQDPTATIKVNGTTVSSGTASGGIALAVGQTTINTVVTAQDGTTTRTYSMTITRAAGPLMSLYIPISVVQPTDNLTIENDGVLVHQGVSPNGDGINDFLTIDGIIAYPNNSLQIIDRNGTLIYQAKGYNNISKVFDGHSGINGRMQPPGTYFYSLDYLADGQSKHKTGFIILKY